MKYNKIHCQIYSISYLNSNLWLDRFPGVIGSSGRMWREHRRFSIYVMKDFGMGKVAAEQIIQNESQIVMDLFESHQGRPFDPLKSINMAVSNIICVLVFGKRFDYDDEEFNASLTSMNDIVHKFGSFREAMMLRSKIGRIFFPKTLREAKACFEGFASFTQKGIDEHKAAYDGTVHDLIDAYLKEIDEQSDTDDSLFVGKNLNY